MRKFRILALMLVLIMVLAGCGTGNSTPAAKDIVILYTNDAHCGIEDGMGYQGLSAAKRALLAAGNKVLLVDNGDAVQGDTIGTLSKGEYIIDIMNKLGYDVATPGNHEFDYGMDQFNKLVEKADFDYISCNFVDKDGNPVTERVYVSVDGGMSDNIRPALYGADYTARLANRTGSAETMLARVCGMHCESGDIVVHEVQLPADLKRGDILAVPVTGAYGRTMASNYNQALIPAVVAVSESGAHVMLRRQTVDDLLNLDVSE